MNMNVARGVAAAVIAATLGFAAWVLVTDPSESAEVARTECIRLASDNLNERLYADVRIMENWTKRGKDVVELGYFKEKSNRSYMRRICVVGNGRLRTPREHLHTPAEPDVIRFSGGRSSRTGVAITSSWRAYGRCGGSTDP
jgi:hypothetical protein